MCRLLTPLLLCASILALSATEAAPPLPKTGPTESMICVDITTETYTQSNWELLLAIYSLQGLINRDNPEKVYLTGWPTRLLSDWKARMAEWPGWIHPAEGWLADGLIPFPRRDAELDASVAYPALRWLLAHAGERVTGQVLYDPKAYGNAAAAVNVCTFEGALPVVPELAAWIAEQGFALETVADVRGMDQHAAFAWSKQRYGDHPKRSPALVAYVSGKNPPSMVDYFVATHSWSYELYSETIQDPDPIDAEYDQLCDPAFYPPGVPHIGPIEGGHVIQRMQKRGHTPICTYWTNASLTSSIPFDPTAFPPLDDAPLPIDRNGLYIAWEYCDDGDAPDVMHHIYNELRSDPLRGKVPGAVRVNPYYLDLFPSLVAWFCQQDQVDVVYSRNDGGASYTREGQMAWVGDYRRHLEMTRHAVRIVNFFGSPQNDFIAALEVPYVITGYQGSPRRHDWGLLENQGRTVFSGNTGTGGTEGDVALLRSLIADLPDDGAPVFLQCRRKDPPSAVQETMDLLLSQLEQRRSIYWVRPAQLGATARAWLLASQTADPAIDLARLDAADPAAAAATAWQVAATPDPAAVQGLIDLLAAEPELAIPALVALGRIGRPAAAASAALVRLASDPASDTRLRLHALVALGALGPLADAHAETLGGLLGDPAVGRTVARTLGGCLDHLPRSVLSRMGSGDPILTQQVALLCETLGPASAEALPQMLAVFAASQDALTRRSLVRAWGSLGAAGLPALPVLTEELVSGPLDDPVLAAAMIASLGALSQADPEAVLPALAKVLHRTEGPMKDLHVGALDAMAALGGRARGMVPLLIERFPHLGRSPQMAAASALTAIGDPADPAIRQTLQAFLDSKSARNPGLRRQVEAFLAGSGGKQP